MKNNTFKGEVTDSTISRTLVFPLTNYAPVYTLIRLNNVARVKQQIYYTEKICYYAILLTGELGDA